MSIPAGPSQSFCHPESEHRSQGKVEVLEMSIYVLGTCMSMYWVHVCLVCLCTGYTDM